MASNASRGAAAKARSKRWLAAQGFTVFDMEIQRVVFTQNGMIPCKRDQLSADIAFMTDDIVVFVQVKSGAKPTTTLVKDARRGFEKYRFPRHSRQEVHIWRPRARQPEVFVIG